MNGTCLDSTFQFDSALSNYLDDLCFIRHKGFQSAANTYSGITYLAPELKDHLPLSARSLHSWSKLQNATEGGPLPTEALGLVIRELAEAEKWWSVIIIVWSFDCYLRESDWESVAAEDISVTTNPAGILQVACQLGSGSKGLSTKTGSNEGVIVDDPFVARILKFLKANSSARTTLIPIDQVQFRREWWEALDKIELTDLGPPHSMRHSRPSLQALTKERTLEEIRRRGRWLSLKSVQRYTKSHTLLAQKSKLSHAQLQQGSALWDGMVTFLKPMVKSHSDLAARALFFACSN
jgi:hypothetical protein